jgi:hypothetical protein
MDNATFLAKKVTILMSLPVRVLNVDDSYQKPLSKAHVRGIVDKFDPMGIGQIHVSKRSDGSFWVFDGQHRTAAYKAKGIKEIDCIVYEGLTSEEEARGYIYYNTIKTQHILDLAKAELLVGDPTMVAIDTAVTGLGLKIDYHRTGNKDTLQAIYAIKCIYNVGGIDDLKMVLRVLKQSLGNDGKNFQGVVLQGIHQFVVEYRNVLEERWLIKRIEKFGLNDLMIKASGYKVIHSCDKKTAVKMAVVNVYNHNRSKENKI